MEWDRNCGSMRTTRVTNDNLDKAEDDCSLEIRVANVIGLHTRLGVPLAVVTLAVNNLNPFT